MTMDLSSVLSICLFIIVLVASLFFFVKVKTNKSRIFISIILGFLLAVVAHKFEPATTFDLVRHHSLVDMYANHIDNGGVFQIIKSGNEIVPQFVSYFVALIGDNNMLQALVVFCGYTLLFYMLSDYRQMSQLNNVRFLLITIIIICGQNMLMYFSGLYNYLAINIFSFAIYMDYVKHKKTIPIILYVLCPLIHISMFFPLAVIIVFKIKKGNVGLRFILLSAIILLAFGSLLGVLISSFNIGYLNLARDTLNTYILHNDKMFRFYGGIYLLINICDIFISIISCKMSDRDDISVVKRLVYFLGFYVVILSFGSIVILRFSPLVLFISLPIIIDISTNYTRNRLLFDLALAALALFYLAYTVSSLAPYINIGVTA